MDGEGECNFFEATVAGKTVLVNVDEDAEPEHKLVPAHLSYSPPTTPKKEEYNEYRSGLFEKGLPDLMGKWQAWAKEFGQDENRRAHDLTSAKDMDKSDVEDDLDRTKEARSLARRVANRRRRTTQHRLGLFDVEMSKTSHEWSKWKAKSSTTKNLISGSDSEEGPDGVEDVLVGVPVKGRDIFPNMILEFVPETLYRVNRRYRKMSQRMPMTDVKVYTYQIIRGLAYIHSVGICHRDVKP